MPLTAEQRKKADERRLARELFETETAKTLATLGISTEEMKSQVGDLVKAVDGLEGIDLKKIIEEQEAIRAGLEKMQESIRNHRGPGYVSGIEDYADKFSLVRAIGGIKSGWTLHKKGIEYEMLVQASQKAGQVIGDEDAGGWFVPEQIIADIITLLYTRSVFIALEGTDGTSRITVLQGLNGGLVRVPKFNGGCVAYWLGEAEDAVLSTVGVATMTMMPRKLVALTRFTDEMLKFQAYGFEEMVRKDMINALAKKLDYTIAYGTGADKMPRGIKYQTGVQTWYAETQSTTAPVGTAVGGELDYTGLMNMRTLLLNSEVDPDGSFSTISSHDYFDRISALRSLNYSAQPDSEQPPYIAGLPPLTRERLSQIIGEHGGTTQIPSNKTLNSVSKFTDVFRGNMGEIVLGRWGGLEILEDEGKSGTNFLSGQRYVKTQLYVDIGVRHGEAIAWCQDARAVA